MVESRATARGAAGAVGRKGRAGLAAAAALIAVITGSACTAAPPATTATPTAATATSGPAESVASAAEIPRIVKELEPSVVTVQTPTGIGSGVVYRSDGIIVTDAHVVEPHKNVRIRFADASEASAVVVGTDNPTDVAVLKADRVNLPAAKFSSSLPVVGELAVVMGSPLGLEQTVTAGIVSALHRNMPPSEELPQGLLDLFQTDAPISPGNSGGPVVNSRSEVIGLAEAYLPPSSGAVDIGFVTPSTTVSDVAEQLLANGTVRRAVLGIVPTELSPEIAERFGLPTDSGALVVEVAGGSPAEQAGLKAGDIITGFDGQKVTSVTDLLAAIRKKEPGQQADVLFQRGPDSRTVKVTLGATGNS